MTKLHEVADVGQSIWLDYMHRSLITSGELRDLVDQGLRGVTSNPSIFEKAIIGSIDYDSQFRRLVDEGKSVEEMYLALVVEDIQRAADVLRPVYTASDAADGFVSLEANPRLAHDTEATIAEVRHLRAMVDRPNVMLKVPATRAGIPAIEQLVSEGININVTLIFGVDQYEAVAEAYLAGLERRSHAQGQGAPLDRAASVASFFVSRIDARVDEALENKGEAAQALKGRIAIAHAKVAYARFREIFAGQRWERLAGQGGRVQRVLWGSTSTKNPVYPDTYYVDNLIAPHTVNTVPSHTLHAFLDHGKVAGTLESGIEAARADLARLSDLGIDLHNITQKLLDDGVQAFIDSFEGLLAGIAHKRDQLRSNQA